MIEMGGKLFWGYWKELQYENFDSGETFEDYTRLKNTISREGVIRHLEEIPFAVMTRVGKDIFTGERLELGQYREGPFVFPWEFLHYYKNYDIGIPYEYEAYLKSIGVK